MDSSLSKLSRLLPGPPAHSAIAASKDALDASTIRTLEVDFAVGVEKDGPGRAVFEEVTSRRGFLAFLLLPLACLLPLEEPSGGTLFLAFLTLEPSCETDGDSCTGVVGFDGEGPC